MLRLKHVASLWFLLFLVILIGACRPVQAPATPTVAPEEAVALQPDTPTTPLPDPEVDQADVTEPDGTPTPPEEELPPQEDVGPILTGTVTFTATVPPHLTLEVTPGITLSLPMDETPTPTGSPPADETPTVTPAPTLTATVTPPATPPVSPTPTVIAPTPTPPLPPTVVLRTHRTFVQGSDRIVVGEVVNGSNASVFDVRIIATFYDGEGQLVGAQETVTLLTATQPRQTNPFRLVLTNAPAVIDRYELSLFWNEISIVEFERASIVGEDVDEGEAGLEIRGELRNDHAQALRDLRVVAAFYDENGHILDVFVGQSDSTQLDPEATTPYLIRARFGDGSTHANVLVQAQGILVR
jgi:hypothetical protein